jgi:CubicO group peptidase (beta-lactamase class C family)
MTAVDAPLLPLPPQPVGVPWPTDEWPTGPVAADVEAMVDEMFGDTDRYGDTYAVVVIEGGRLVHERYGGALPSFEHEPTPVTIDTPLLSWSMAKSVLHGAVGVLVGRGELDLDAPAPVALWSSPDDPRHAITLEHLLDMRDGLDFAEDYVDAGVSDVIEMLFGSGKDDVAAFAADRGLAHAPGEFFNYSSGTSNIVAAIVGDVVGRGEATTGFLRDVLFDPIGMRSAEARLDAAGTFIGSSFLYATGRDYARFGLLALRGGEWDGERVLPEGWIDHGRRPRSVDPEDGALYGAHWWVAGDEYGRFSANGYEGQLIDISPARDRVAVRLGRSPEEHKPALLEWWRRFARTGA